MKRLFLICSILLLTLPLWAVTLYGQSGKICYIDSYRIRSEYKEFTEAQTQFDKELAQWEQESTGMQNELDSLKKDLSAKALLLSEEARSKKEELIGTKEAALQKYMVDVFGQGGKAEQKNKEMTKPLLDKITAVLEKIAQDNGYDYVFDSVNGNIAYAKKTLDITDKVLEELQKLQ